MRNGETRKYAVTVRFLGGEKTQVFAAAIKGLDKGHFAFLQSDSLIYYETSDPLTQLESPRLIPFYRQLWIDENADRGDSWEDYDTGTRTLFAGFDSVTVPAGHFTDCYKTVTEALPELADTIQTRYARGEITLAEMNEQLENSNRVVVRWFAPGVGLVKEKIGLDDFVRVLVAVDDEGVAN